jgi:hypothetical protein
VAVSCWALAALAQANRTSATRATNAPVRPQFLGETKPAFRRLTEKLRLRSIIAIAPFVLRSRRLVRKRTRWFKSGSGKLLLNGFALGFREKTDSDNDPLVHQSVNRLRPEPRWGLSELHFASQGVAKPAVLTLRTRRQSSSAHSNRLRSDLPGASYVGEKIRRFETNFNNKMIIKR